MLAFGDLWSLNERVLSGEEGSRAMRAAVGRLVSLLESTQSQQTGLQQELFDNGSNEHRHMLTLVKHLLRPLVGTEPNAVILNKMEYASVPQEGPKTGFLGVGTQHTWHGAADCRCDVDIVSLAQCTQPSLTRRVAGTKV